MSLVSDALRKARQEAAAEQQQLQPGVVYTGAIAGYSRRSRALTVLVLGITIALAAAIGGGVVVWWALARSDSPEPTAATPADSTAPEAPVAVVAEAPDQSQPAPAQPQPEPKESMPDDQPTPLAEALPSKGSSSPAVSAAQPPATEPTPTQVAEEHQERVHVIEADLGYATLSLGFLVYRSDDPYAEINGTEIHEGQHIEGFLLEKIEQDQVLLRDDHGPLILKVR